MICNRLSVVPVNSKGTVKRKLKHGNFGDHMVNHFKALETVHELEIYHENLSTDHHHHYNGYSYFHYQQQKMKSSLSKKNREESGKIVNCDLGCGPNCDPDLVMGFEFGGNGGHDADTSSCKNEMPYTILLLCLSALLLLLPLVLPSLPPPPPILMLIPIFILGVLFLLMASVPPSAEVLVGTPL